MNSNSILQDFLKEKQLRSYPKGSVIVRPDDPLQNVYYLQEGWVRQFSVSSEGEELTINIYRPGSYFTVVFLLSNHENLHYFEAMTQVSVKKIEKTAFLNFIKQNPEVLFELTTRISRGIMALVARTESLVFGTAVNKVAANLFLTASRFDSVRVKDATKVRKEVVIPFPLTHRQIATMAGLTRETVSIVMMKLKKKGVLHYSRQQLTIFDLEQLFELSSLNI